MSSQVCDATDGVALHFDIGRVHLSDQRLKATKLNDKDLVVCYEHVLVVTPTDELSWRKVGTINSEVSQSGTSSSLYLNIATFEKE